MSPIGQCERFLTTAMAKLKSKIKNPNILQVKPNITNTRILDSQMVHCWIQDINIQHITLVTTCLKLQKQIKNFPTFSDTMTR